MKEKNIDIFKLKIIGMITMTMLNLALSGIIKNYLITVPLGIIGCMSITIFAFLIVEGYRHTSSLNKYMLRILLVTAISAYPYQWVFGTAQFDPRNFFNSALTAFICLGSLYMYDRMKTKETKIFFLVFITSVSIILSFEWAPFAILLTLIIHIYRDKEKIMYFYIITGYTVLFVVSLVTLLMNPEYSNKAELVNGIRQIGCLLALPLIKKYNGNLGKPFKWPLYFYYPILLLTLFFIKNLLV